MSYPLINGAAINEMDGQAVFAVSSLSPVRFEQPRLSFGCRPYSAGAATFGAAHLISPAAAPLRPVRFGDISVPMWASPVQGPTFGTPALRMAATGLAAAKFGEPRLKYGTDVVATPLSISAARFGAHGIIGGMPPDAGVFPAGSLRGVQFGKPSMATSLHAGQAGALQPVKFGAVTAGTRNTADALRPMSFGTQVMTVAMPAAPLRPTKFGGASTVAAFTVAPLEAVRFGAHAVALPTMYLPANSLQPVQFGPLLTPPGQSARARGAMPVRFGRPSLDRGVAC